MQEKYHRWKFRAVMSLEIGGNNSIQPLMAAAHLALPVVDADTIGRAYPEAQMTSVAVGGLKPYPCALFPRRNDQPQCRSIQFGGVQPPRPPPVAIAFEHRPPHRLPGVPQRANWCSEVLPRSASINKTACRVSWDGYRCVQLLHHLLDTFIEASACSCGCHAARSAVEQTHAEARFQLTDGLTERGG